MNPAEFQQAAQQAGFHQTIYHPIGAPQNFQNFFVPNLQPEPSIQKQPKKSKGSSEVDDLNEYQDEYNEEEDDDESDGKKEKYTNSNRYSNQKAPKLTYAPSKYTPGKTAYSSQIKNISPQYYATNSHPVVQPTLTPYQKYSFQPVTNLKSASFENVQSTPLPYKTPYVVSKNSNYAQSTNTQPQKLKGNCRKVEKQLSKEDLTHGRFRRGADEMTCFVCDNPKGGSYEQCSYTSDPNNNSDYFTGHASKYSTNTYDPDNDGYREKRSPRR